MRPLILGLCAVLAGCASAAPPQAPVAPVKVQIVGHDYCAIMRRINGPAGVFAWSVSDTPLSITQMRRANAAYSTRCPAPATPTS